MRRIKYDVEGNAMLNPAPEQWQYALYAKHKARGTSPGNPTWYKRVVAPAPFRFKPGMPPAYPKLPSGADWNTKHNKFSAKRPEDVPTRYK